MLKDYQINVPCGKCPTCKARRVSHWSFRLMQHDKIANSSRFITLTYDTQNVPITAKGFMSLQKRDLQLFFKRLRKAHGKTNSIKYYACGEYGGKTLRPHYHIILFDADIEKIQPAWNLGHVHYGDVSGASVGYTLKYINKTKKIPLHQNDDRQPEFALMSKKIGINYLTPQMVNWHKKGKHLYAVIEDGKKISLPRYFKDKIWNSRWDKTTIQLMGIELEKQIDKETNYFISKNPMYFHNKLQSDIRMWNALEQKATKNDKI